MLVTTGAALRGYARAGNARVLTRSLAAGRWNTSLPRQNLARITPPAARSLSLWPFSSSQVPASRTLVEPEPSLVTAEGIPSAITADASTAPVDVPSGALDSLADTAYAAVASNPSVLHAGDLAALGLTGWSPIGSSVQLLETLNVTFGLSWLSTIVVGTLLARAICAPFAIQAQRNTARIAPHQQRLRALSEELQKTKGSQDIVAVQRIMLEQRETYGKAGVKISQLFVLPFAQLPVSLGMFFAVKRVMAAPIESLHTSGIGHLIPMYADLTASDPYYILPVLTSVLMNAMLSIMGRDMLATTERTTVGAMLLAFRVMSVVSIPMIGHWSIGMNAHVLTGVVAVSVQMLFLRIPRLRKALGIAPLPKVKEQPPGLRESLELAGQWWNKTVSSAQSQAAQGPPRKW